MIGELAILGSRAGVVVFAYAVTAIIFLLGSKELQAHFQLLGSIVVFMVIVSAFRFSAGLRLSKAGVTETDSFLKRYGWWSLANILCLGLFAAAMIYKLGLNQQSMIIIVVLAGFTGAAIGTMALYINLWATFIMISWIPVILACFYSGYQGSSQGYLLALMCLVFAVFIVVIGKRVANE